MPVRTQLSRRAGHIADGTSVRVDRATVWGNPFRSDIPNLAAIAAGARTAADAYDLWLRGHPALADVEPERRSRILAAVRQGLRGRDLACWCGPDAPCHADVLLRLANSDDPLPSFVEPRPRSDVPELALSVRQPWAWAIIHAGKNIENRSWRQPNPGLRFRGPVCIHASTGLGRDEFDDAIESIEFATTEVTQLPQARELVRGAIIGVVDVVDIVRKSSSPWWCGPVGLVLANARPVEPIPCKGQLGFFKWTESGALAEPAKWMLPPAPKTVRDRAKKPEPERGPDLFNR